MAEIIAAIAAEWPDDVALVDEQGETTWRDFGEHTNRLINALRAHGLEPGATFALMAGNRREAFEASMAAAHGSWVYVPVNWHWVPDELAYVVNDSGARALIVEDQFLDVAVAAVADFEDCPLRIVIGTEAPEGFVTYEEFLAGASAEEPEGQASGGPMFYTSGTTGFPKGVRGPLCATGDPAAMLQLVGGSIAAAMGMPADGVTLLEGPMYHSAQWVFSVAPLVTGSTVVMRHRFDPAEMLELIDRYRVTNTHLVPTQFIRLLKLPDEERESFDGSSLQAAWHGAAPCPLDVKRQMIEWWGPVVHEYYGGTEGGLITTIAAEEWLERPGSLGKETEMVEVMVITDDGRPAAPNESGQLYFRSKMGSDFEYHNAPDKTAAAHLEPGVATLGDVGYLDEDGYLFMSDRKIDMIISGGVNIYPAEIEGVLVSHPAVQDAAVFGIPHDEMGEQVKAAVELAAGTKAGDALAAELIEHCREHLAHYKAPRSVDFEDQLPRHPTGKLYKRLLRDAYWEDVGRSV